MPSNRSKEDKERGFSSFVTVLNIGSLKKGGSLFNGSDGEKTSNLITKTLRDLPCDSVLVVDLSDIRQASHSGLIEVFSILDVIRNVALEGKNLVFQVDMNHQEMIESIAIIARDRRYMIPVIDKAGKWQVFGKLTKSQRDTMKAVLEYEEITSTQLKEQLNILNVAASNRLRLLYDLGLIRREERIIPGRGGREFVYKLLISQKQPGKPISK